MPIRRQVLLPLLVAALGFAEVLDGQEVQGQVIDRATDAPVAGAELVFTDSSGAAFRRILTSEAGTFSLMGPPMGPLGIQVNALGYEASAEREVFYTGQPLFLEIVLEPSPLSAEAIRVRVSPQKLHLRSVGFYDRFRRGHGDFVTPEQIAARNISKPSGYLRGIASIRLVSGREPVMARSQGFGRSPLDCVPNLYIDGIAVRLRSALDNLWDPNAFDNVAPPPEDIEAIEVYPGGSTMPERWRSSNSSCGAIVIWTKR